MIISIYSQSNIDKHAWYVEKFKIQTHFSSHLHVGMNLHWVDSIASAHCKHNIETLVLLCFIGSVFNQSESNKSTKMIFTMYIINVKTELQYVNYYWLLKKH
jgi:hypothetical protein